MAQSEPRCTNCGVLVDVTAPATRIERWTDGFGTFTPTGRVWCGLTCADMTASIEGGRRASLSVGPP
jgi:hypothetical protein